MKGKRIIIGLPSATGSVPLDWSVNLTAIVARLQKLGYQVMPVAVSRTFIDKARNAIASVAIEKEADYLFFLDDDTYISPDGVQKLLELDKDIASPPVADRKGEKTINVFNKGLNRLYDLEETKKVTAVGMACTLIKCSVLKELFKEYMHPFEFQIGSLNDERIEISEDVGFCLRAEKKGYETWAVKNIKTSHLGEPRKYEYNG